MAEIENEVSTEQEPYVGAELDTIEVPDESNLLQLDDSSAGNGAKEEGGNEETAEQRKARKRNDYQKRLNELVRQRHEEAEARAAAEAKAELLEQRLRDMEQAKGDKPKAGDLSQREQELIEKRRTAESEGDLELYTEAQDELFEVRMQLRGQREQPEPPVKPVQPEERKIVPEAQEWMEENPWFAQKGNEHLAAEVVRIQDALLQDGYSLLNPQDAKKVYAELSRRIRDLPEFDEVLGANTETEEREEPAQRTPPRSHIAPPSRGGEAPPRAKAGELTQHDIRAMKMVGIDPNDPKARAAYIKRKRG